MPKHLTPLNTTYKALVGKITNEFDALEFLLKNRTAESYWKVGRWIHQHLLENEKRANYGATLFIRLAKDVERDVSSLQRAVQFYRAYPISADQRKLSWDHYKSLITIKDDKERKRIEDQALRQDWSTTKLREYLNVKREFSTLKKDDKPIAQLKFTRGKIHIYPIVKANNQLAQKRSLALDFGFRLQHSLPSGHQSVQESDIVELTFKDGVPAGVQKISATQDELFTYPAQVDKVIDGDTLLVSFDFHGRFSLAQKLRLRGIDCPEKDTDEGKRAKRFVESRLKSCDFIIVKTYKDRSDKFDRYLADVFYLPQSTDPQTVANEGNYLNQELLNEHLAIGYE